MSDKQTYEVIGACMEVHSELGNGFLEYVYQEALEKEFKIRSIPYKKEVELPIYYNGEKLETSYRVDFLCYENIIVELKAVKELAVEHQAQTMNYLKATGLKRALLINFGKSELEYKRIVNGWKE